MSEITLITATGDRPEAFRLCEKWMARQTFKDYDWIVVDDGAEATGVTQDQQYIRLAPAANPQDSFRRNLSVALECIRTPKVLFVEDDDFYDARYVEFMSAMLDMRDLVGCGRCKYYHVGYRKWKLHTNVSHASLCQTGIRTGDYLMRMQDYLRKHSRPQQLDGHIWRRANVPDSAKLLIPCSILTIAIKGVPGRKGLGIHHTKQELENTKYKDDPDGEVLRQWVGEADAEVYLNMQIREKANENPECV